MTVQTEERAVSVNRAAQLAGISRANMYQVIARGELPARRLGARRTVVLVADLQRWLESLPLARDRETNAA